MANKQQENARRARTRNLTEDIRQARAEVARWDQKKDAAFKGAHSAAIRLRSLLARAEVTP